MENEDYEKDYVQTEVVHAIPIASEKASNIFCYAALADKQTGTIYTNCTGALPAMSLNGNQYYFVAYDYNNNYIFAVLIPDLKMTPLLKHLMVYSQSWRKRDTNQLSMLQTIKPQEH